MTDPSTPWIPSTRTSRSPKRLSQPAPRVRLGRQAGAGAELAMRTRGRALLVLPVAAALVGGLTPWVAPGGGLGSAAAAASRPADTAGAAALGSARYAVPPRAVFVSSLGSDAAPGTLSRPVKTFARALQIVPYGGTLVVRRGAIHESILITKSVTIQNYPGEAFWLDGSVPITGWKKSGSVWRHDNWTPRFDSSPTYTKGAPDNREAGWGFVNAAYPMAAHPDMVFVDEVSQRQVKSLSLVKPGSFFLDTATSRLYLGTDPTRKKVRGTDLAKAISVRAPDVTLRGFGLRRFGASVWHMGAVTVEQPRGRLSQMRIDQMATTGLSAISSDITVERTTIIRSGMLGMHASTADRLRVESSAFNGNNVERFNTAPVSGGMKIAKSRNFTLRRTRLSDNFGPGFWADQSVYDMKLSQNNILRNNGAGVFLEISAVAKLVDNLIVNNTGNGIKVNNTSSVRIWNNTLVGNNREINIVQDPRLASNTSWGHDPRSPNDPAMTWMLGPVEVRNNVLGLSQAGNCLLCVEDYTYTRTAAQIGVTAASDIFNRTSSKTPQWTHVWSNGKKAPSVYTALSLFQKSTGQDRSSLAYENSAVVNPNGALSATVSKKGALIAVPLPSALATLAAQPAGARRAGVWGR